MTPIFSLVFTIVIIISVLLAIVIIRHLQTEKAATKLLKDFEMVADEFYFTVGTKEILGPRVIAFNKESNGLLYFSGSESRQEGYLVDLADVRSVTVKREYEFSRSFSKYFAGPQPVVSSISLQFHYHHTEKPLALNFYRKSVDHLTDFEHRQSMAHKWQRLVTARLPKPRLLDERAKRPGKLYAI